MLHYAIKIIYMNDDIDNMLVLQRRDPFNFPLITIELVDRIRLHARTSDFRLRLIRI